MNTSIIITSLNKDASCLGTQNHEHLINAVHNKLDGNVWEPKIMKKIMEELLLDVIKSFFKVQFQSHIDFFFIDKLY